MKPILICGAGIAGLSLARLLGLRAIPYKIIEKMPRASVTGAGIALPANAMNLLDYMNLGTIIRGHAYQVKSVTYASPSEHLSTASLEEEPLNKNHFVALHRAKLHEILMSTINIPIHYSTEVTSLIETKAGILVTLNENGVLIQEEFGAIIGADGIHSKLRKTVFTDHVINDFGLTIWRWVCKWNVQDRGTEPFYMFDRDRVFMVYPISSEEVYCYAHVVDKESYEFSHENSRETLRSLFSHCTHEIIQSMLHQLPENNSIIIGKMQSVEIPAFSKGRVCLIGDACHACTPMLQQGAALAFEDAIVLTELIDNFPIEHALSFYREFRSEKVTNTVLSSNIPIRNLSRKDVDIESVYSNIRINGPLNVQGWRKILSSSDLMTDLGAFISTKKRANSAIYFGFASNQYQADSEENHSDVHYILSHEYETDSAASASAMNYKK